MAVTSLPLISQLTIRDAADAGSYARGKEYHRLGRVKRLEWRPDENRLVGAVRGSHSEPYATSVWLAEDVSGSEVTASSCSCPIGGHCKHVVASLLAYHERVVAESAAGLPRPADPGAGQPGAGTAAHPVAAETAAPPGLEDRTGRVDPRRRRPAEQHPAGAQQLPAARPAVSRRRPEAGHRGGPAIGGRHRSGSWPGRCSREPRADGPVGTRSGGLRDTTDARRSIHGSPSG